MDQRATILLVDDQALNLDALEAILDAPEHRIVRAQSAEEALLALLNEDFAVIVLDIKMPGVSGLELATLIKARRRTQHIPILFLTAHLLEERDVLRGYGAGAVDYLSKPVNPDIFRSKISVFVDLFRKTRALAEANAALQTEVAERQRIQDALAEANDALESRVRDRTQDLTVLNQALRENEERLRLAVTAAGLHAWEMDLETRQIRFEPGAAEAFGFEPGSWDGHLDRTAAVIHPDDKEATLSAFYAALTGGLDYAGEFRLLGPGGAVYWIINRGRIFRDETGTPSRALGLFMDITNRKRTEDALRAHNERLDAAVLERTRDLQKTHERLRQTERLASVGTLAAGLGHDMSNLLLPIRARLDSLAGNELESGAVEDVAAIREASGYLQRLASGLRLLAMDPDAGGEREQCTDLSSWWHDVEGVFRAALPRGVRLEGALPANLPPVAIAASRLTQAIFNLVQNAGEAVSGPRSQGETTGRISLSAELVTPEGATDGAPPVISLSVCDNGPGMAPEVAARCFEPYFSTKIRAVSTGMGLPMVRAWVEAAGGRIQLRTSPGHGAEFILDIPAGELPSRRATVSPGASIPRAALTLDDSRTTGFVSAIVAASGCTASVWSSDGVPDADLWVVSGASATPERVAAFLAQGPERRAVVLADVSAAALRGGSHHAEGTHPLSANGSPVIFQRVRYMGRRPTSADLRQCLLESLSDQSASHASATASPAPAPA